MRIDPRSFKVFLEISSSINIDMSAKKKLFDKAKLDISHT